MAKKKKKTGFAQNGDSNISKRQGMQSMNCDVPKPDRHQNKHLLTGLHRAAESENTSPALYISFAKALEGTRKSRRDKSQRQTNDKRLTPQRKTTSFRCQLSCFRGFLIRVNACRRGRHMTSFLSKCDGNRACCTTFFKFFFCKPHFVSSTCECSSHVQLRRPFHNHK